MSRFIKESLLLVILLVIFLIQTILSMKEKSPVFDEIDYLPSSYSYVITGKLKVELVQPPLTRTLYGTPLLFLKLRNPIEFKSWNKKIVDPYEFGRDFFYNCGEDPERVLFFVRLISVLIGMLLGILVFLWSKKLYGKNAGLLSLLLYIFSPLVLAHSQLVTTDIAMAFMSLVLSLIHISEPTR
ncbi:MAG: glycosyltransferase family 39 protein, partial [Candidatus Omnitrophica bacterium]|nr:glycosyltransferase family 39 protein [Candidatus Omnitrophota bacterium]